MLSSKRGDRATTLGWPHRAPPPVGTIWLLIVTGLALTASRAQVVQLFALIERYPDRGPERARSFVFVLATVGLATALTALVGLLRPAWWRRAILALVLFPVPPLLITSRNVVAAGAAVALLCPALWLGREVAARLLRPIGTLEAWAIGGTFGVAGLIALGFALGHLALLHPQVVWPVLLVGGASLLTTARRRLRDDLAGFLSWMARPAALRPGRALLTGLLVGYCWLNLIGALAPEIMSDAVVTRSPAAALFARTGRFAVDPDLGSTVSPGAGEILNAVVLTAGPLQSAKIVTLLVGALCAAGVWSLGRRLGGRRAGEVALVAFYTLPLTAWLSQTAHVDLLATLFAVTATALLVLHERLDRRAVVAAAVCIGLGLGVKLSFIAAAAGLVAALVLAVLRRGRVTISAALAALAAALLLLGLLLGVFWTTRGSARLGAMPSVALATEFVAQARSERSGAFAEFGSYGAGRSLIALARSPLDVTVRTNQYSGYRDGFAGYLLLALAPLVLVRRPNWRVGVTLVAAVIGYILWFFVAQILRFALPIFALLCAVGGWAYVAVGRSDSKAARTLMGLLVVVLAGLGPIGYLNSILAQPGHFPYRVVLGGQSKTDYLTYNLSGYGAVSLLDAEPGATRVLATNDYARLYTRVRTTSVVYARGLEDEASLLGYLDREGFSHIIVARDLLGALTPDWDQLLAIDEEFLRRNTILVGGDRNAYLYRLVPPEQRGQDQSWARGRELLANGGFEEARGALPLGWTAAGQPTYDASGAESRAGRGAIRSTPEASYFATTAVAPNERYLLSHATRSAGEAGQARLQINWLDRAGSLVGVSIDVVPVSPRGYHRYSMLATAPPTASTAVIYAQAQGGTVWFDDISLRSAGPSAPMGMGR